MSNIWILGGVSGIGKACEKTFKSFGHDTYVDGLDSCDVRTEAGPIARLEYFKKNNVALDAVVFSVGVNYLDWIGQLEMFHVRDMASTNYLGFINLLDILVRHVGRPLDIVAISSDAAERPMRTSIGYCASKAALNMAVRVAARELGPKGWRVNAVAPGMIAGTNMTASVEDQVMQKRGWSENEMLDYERQQEVVQGRIHPFEVAQVVYDLVLGPTHMNGSIITLNGGRN